MMFFSGLFFIWLNLHAQTANEPPQSAGTTAEETSTAIENDAPSSEPTDAAPVPAIEQPIDKPQPPDVQLPTKVKPDQKKAQKKENNNPEGFRFGSYGRVVFGTNSRGEPVYPVNITAHGPRLQENTYMELDMMYKFMPNPHLRSRVVSTLALNDTLFHYNGDWESGIAVRNLFLEMYPLTLQGFSFWAGSRMYRGDDIYLLDYWPLDNLNTVGAGVWIDRKPLRGGLHMGFNRIRGPYQYQEDTVNTTDVGQTTVVSLNRQRFIASGKLEYWQMLGSDLGFKIKGYSEFHQLPSGTYNALGEPVERIELPSENGLVLGAQIGLWGFALHSFVNVFARYATGIAAYGEFSQPLGLGSLPDLAPDYSARDARDFVLAIVGNYVLPGRLGVQLGAYWRSFLDADGLDFDWDDGTELVFAARPMLFIPELFGRQIAIGGEISYQRTDRAGLHPETSAPAHPSVWKFSFLPTWISGSDTYSRPAVRFFYTVALPNEDARLWYHRFDDRRTRSVEHFVGISAEWWFNSSTYQ